MSYIKLDIQYQQLDENGKPKKCIIRGLERSRTVPTSDLPVILNALTVIKAKASTNNGFTYTFPFRLS